MRQCVAFGSETGASRICDCCAVYVYCEKKTKPQGLLLQYKEVQFITNMKIVDMLLLCLLYISCGFV